MLFRSPSDWALFTVGGYGRGELQPASDVDLLLLAPEPEPARDAAATSANTVPPAPQASPANSPSEGAHDTPSASTAAGATTAPPAPALSDDTIAHIERFIGACWDIGLEIGHSVRTPAQCAQAAREDITAMTALLERRQLTGHRRAARQLSEAMAGQLQLPLFLRDKLLEMRQRHQKYEDTPYSLIEIGRASCRERV